MNGSINIESYRIRKMDLDIMLDEKTQLHFTPSFSASMYPPTDEQDPTVKVCVECTLDPSENVSFHVHCMIEYILSFDVIPEDRSGAIAAFYSSVLRGETIKNIQTALNAMGHSITDTP